MGLPPLPRRVVALLFHGCCCETHDVFFLAARVSRARQRAARAAAGAEQRSQGQQVVEGFHTPTNSNCHVFPVLLTALQVRAVHAVDVFDETEFR